MTWTTVSFIIFALLSFYKVFALEELLPHTIKPEDFTPQFLEINEDMAFLNIGRALLPEEFPAIRISANYDYLETAPSSFKDYLQKELAPPVISWFQGALRVKYPVIGNIKVGSDVKSLCGQDTPSVLLTTGVEADYFIFFNSKYEESKTIASSSFCLFAASTRRPLIATSILNRKWVVPANGNILLHEKNTYLLIHEMMHTFGFSDNAFPLFIDENGKPRKNHIVKTTLNGLSTIAIDVPPLTEKLKKFFGCSSLIGAYMENNGGNGTKYAHFERKLFTYEVMSSGDILGRRISEFSLALLEGSGWYVPDYSYAEPYFFGQGQGCSFISGSCSKNENSFEEYCTGKSRGCSPQGNSGGKCFSDPSANGCKYLLPNINYHCENPNGGSFARLPQLQAFGKGEESKCFTGTLNTKQTKDQTSFCFKYECKEEAGDMKLEVRVGENLINCEAAGPKTIEGFFGSIDCPDPLTFCKTIGKQYCPRNCMGRGSCVNNKCKCNQGFKGTDCGLIDTFDSNMRIENTCKTKSIQKN